MKTLTTLTVAAVLVTGCQTESAPEPTTEATPVAFNIGGAPIAQLKVPDMMCQYSCAAKVKEVLTAQLGVKDVKVDFDTKIASIAVDETEFDGEAAVAALVDYQFSNTKLIVTE